MTVAVTVGVLGWNFNVNRCDVLVGEMNRCGDMGPNVLSNVRGTPWVVVVVHGLGGLVKFTGAERLNGSVVASIC